MTFPLFGAEDGTRTHDLLITNQLLYQLSHISVAFHNDKYYTINKSKKQALFEKNITFFIYVTCVLVNKKEE